MQCQRNQNYGIPLQRMGHRLQTKKNLLPIGNSCSSILNINYIDTVFSYYIKIYVKIINFTSRNLYERIVVLEQENRELSITVSNQKNQLAIMYLRNCNGIYIWRLQSFQEKLTAMINDPLKMFYSPGFYTSSNGYKICARINISSKDSNYLSLLLHIMKSENDDGLDWPFNGTMHFVLVHPQDSEKNICEITSSRPDLEAFRKPTCELNKRSFGYTEFVRICDISNFLQNNSLIFRIEVRAHNLTYS